MRENPIFDEDELDRATRARLARLASMPVDTTNLERRLKAAISAEVGASAPAPRQHSGFRLWKPVFSLAAALAIAAVILGVIFGTGTTPVIAAPADLAKVHDAMNMHTSTATVVTSMDEANRVIASQWSDAPSLPTASLSEEQVRGCCLHDLKGRKVVCVLMRDGDNAPVTMLVARTQDVKCSQSGMAVKRNGRQYMVHDTNGLRMVMTEGNGKFVCLMGNGSVERLLEVAALLSF